MKIGISYHMVLRAYLCAACGIACASASPAARRCKLCSQKRTDRVRKERGRKK